MQCYQGRLLQRRTSYLCRHHGTGLLVRCGQACKHQPKPMFRPFIQRQLLLGVGGVADSQHQHGYI
jgi:hypothetical protein